MQLVCPAGNLPALQAAVDAGADAVYAGFRDQTNLNIGEATFDISALFQRPGDANIDGTVNVDDLLAVVGAWGACPAAPAFCPIDMDGDGSVDIDDLLLVIGHWR